MREAGVMLVVNPDGLILGITRRNDRTKYGLPGGKRDLILGDKNVMDAAVRETMEETGIKVTSCVEIYKQVEIGDGVNAEDFYSTCFYASHWEGTPRDSEEGEVKWLTSKEVTCSRAAFGDYNRKTLDVFKTMFPDVKLEGELCSGGCHNTGWQNGDNEGFICNFCDRACVCNAANGTGMCYVHQGK